uniref:Uncharacterized protein n=1 Tax=Oncorhynchus tshawytscha TaxID=74940 RepID=A0AAZ3RZ61_ONCTS
VAQIHFLQGQGRLLSLLDDNTLHLWEDIHVCVCYNVCDVVSSASRVTVLLLLRSCDLLCVGTEGGGIHFLDLPLTAASLPEDYRCGKSLGPVESLQEHPKQPGKILIGYSRGLVVLWDLSTCNAEHMFLGKQLESLVWERSGSSFVSSHSDGGYSVWAVASGNTYTHQPVSSSIPYGERQTYTPP